MCVNFSLQLSNFSYFNSKGNIGHHPSSGQKVASSDIMLIGVVDPLSSFARQLKRDHAIAAATLQFCVHWFKGVIKSLFWTIAQIPYALY